MTQISRRETHFKRRKILNINNFYEYIYIAG